MNQPVTLLGLALVASAVTAQQIIVPDLQALANAGTSTAVFRTQAARLQAAYDSSLFTASGVSGPIVINRLRFRQLDGRRNPNGQTYSGVTVEVGNCAVDHAAMTTTYATNRGAMGPLGVIPLLTVGAASGAYPNTYNVDIDLLAIGAAVVYDPSTGTDLLIDITMPNDPVAAAPGAGGGGTASGVPTTTVTPAAGHTLVFSSGTFIRFTSGVNAGRSRSISSMVAATSITHGAFPVAAAAGDTFVVERLDMEGFACGSVTATHKSKRNSGVLPGGAAALSDFGPVVLIDFVGLGGYATAAEARVESYGGSTGAAQSFYQTFPLSEPFDLAGTSLTLTPDSVATPTTYTVTGGATAPDLSLTALGGGAPNQTDDGVVLGPLGYTFNFPGGNTTVIGACTNGYVWLSGSTVGQFTVALVDFLGIVANPAARLAPFWHDFHAGRNIASHPGSGLYVNTDTSGGPGNFVTYVTWKEIGEFNTLALPQGISVNTMQCVITQATGVVEYRYGSFSGARFGSGITGFSRGNVGGITAVDSISRDLSLEVPFTTSPEGTQPALAHGVTARAVQSRTGVAATMSLTAGNHLPGTPAGAFFLDFANTRPGINFLPLDPQNILSLGLTPVMHQLFITPVGNIASSPITIPLAIDPTWNGAVIYSQYATLQLSGTVQTSNALKHTIGLQ